MEQRPNQSIDAETVNRITEIGTTCLNQAMLTHSNLGAKGIEPIVKNQFGETALRADVEIEKAIIDILKKSRIPARIYSEEHGIVDLTASPTFIVVLDGLDGSSEYKKFRKTGRYGTMLGIFKGINSKYKDFLFSGIAEQVSGTIIYSSKKIETLIKTRQKTSVAHTSGVPTLDVSTKIYFSENDFDTFNGDKKPFLKARDKINGQNIKKHETKRCFRCESSLPLPIPPLPMWKLMLK